MREFVKSLAEMESARQDVKLASLVSEKKKSRRILSSN